MGHQIKTVYVVHHSHTDIGYTDLQERIVFNQVDYIRTVLGMMQRPEYADFRWNCETLFCVEEFFKGASVKEKDLFCSLAADGKLGLSANYLNFNDLLDAEVYKERLGWWKEYFQGQDVPMRTAMIADINGISMGCRDAMLDNGVEFLYTNIHCHHGMYPLGQNQTAYQWEDAAGRRMLVWNGEHYNLGNVLGFKPNKSVSYMQRTYLGTEAVTGEPAEELYSNLTQYMDTCVEQGYDYDFMIASVSGVFSDNAPPAPEILHTIEEFNRLHGDEILIRMVSLAELYEAIREKLADAPVYRGDLTDWWANGVGSTPYAVKHYKEAWRLYHLCRRLDADAGEKYPEHWKCAQDNLMLYAEHTWGHSSTITNPYDTMVLNLDMRKNSYASKAHEAASMILNEIAKEKGDILRYYNTDGTIRVCGVGETDIPQPVEFYIESMILHHAEVRDQAGNVIPCQVSPHPRGRKISFTDTIARGKEKTYTYKALPPVPDVLNTRKCYAGSERVRDIVNEYDPESYHLPYYFENQFFRLDYEVHKGITAFLDKRTGRDMLGDEAAPFFTPLYEVTEVRHDDREVGCPQERERRIMGRNIRGQHAVLHTGCLEEVVCEERGPVFTVLRLRYAMPGSVHTEVWLKFYADIPRIDFGLELGKTISADVESVFLSLNLGFEGRELYLKKGTEAFRPGIDQIPGTCMEFYMSDAGLAYAAETGGAMIAMYDTPLLYMGEMRHHPIRLCEGRSEDNRRPVYSWVMNNDWETNFKMDLSGFGTYEYSLWLTEETDGESAMNRLNERMYNPYVLIVE